MKTRDYMAAAKKALGGISDYALAKALGVTQQSVSLLVNGHSIMSNTTAARVAELLELDPLRVIADAELERGSDAQLWKRIRDAAVWAMFAIGAASFGVLPGPAHAGFDISGSSDAVHSPARRLEYALHTILARALAWLRGWL